MDISERLSEDGTVHDAQRLKELQALPLDRKIQITQARIIEFVERMGGVDNVVVSTSGGKDSAVLLHLARMCYPTIRCIFVNTGLEYPEIQATARRQGAIFVRPTMQFADVIREYGYPLVSKEVAEAIYYARRIRNADESFDTTPPKTQGINKCEDDVETAITSVPLDGSGGGRDDTQTARPSRIRRALKQVHSEAVRQALGGVRNTQETRTARKDLTAHGAKMAAATESVREANCKGCSCPAERFMRYTVKKRLELKGLRR